MLLDETPLPAISLNSQLIQLFAHHNISLRIIAHLKNMCIKGYKTIFLIEPDGSWILLPNA